MPAFFKVRAGQVVGHCGVDLPEGSILELPPHVGADIGALEPCTADGDSLAALTPDQLQVAWARQHERLSILELQVAAARAALADAEARLEDEQTKPEARATALADFAPADE